MLGSAERVFSPGGWQANPQEKIRELTGDQGPSPTWVKGSRGETSSLVTCFVQGLGAILDCPRSLFVSGTNSEFGQSNPNTNSPGSSNTISKRWVIFLSVRKPNNLATNPIPVPKGSPTGSATGRGNGWKRCYRMLTVSELFALIKEEFLLIFKQVSKLPCFRKITLSHKSSISICMSHSHSIFVGGINTRKID